MRRSLMCLLMEWLILPVVCIERKTKRELVWKILQITLKPVDIKFLNRNEFFVFDKHIKNIVCKFNVGLYIVCICILLIYIWANTRS